MTIAYFLGQFPKLSNSFVTNEIAELQKRGLEVRIFSLDEPVDERSRELMGRFGQVCYVKKETRLLGAALAHLIFLMTSPARYLSLAMEALSGKTDRKIFLKFLWVARRLKDGNVDVIHGHFAQGQSVLARIAGRLLNVPYTFKIHGSEVLLRRVAGLDLLLRDAACCQVVSDHIKCHIQENYGSYDNITVHPCGINLSRFSNKSGYGQGDYVLCVARQISNKGIEFLVEAMRLLKERGRSYKAIIIGDGPDREIFMEQAMKGGLGEEIKFIPAMPNAELVKYYSGASVFVLPSLCEGLGVVLLEAMACGVPVVGTDVGGIPEIIKDGFNGFIVRPKDSNGLADKIEYLMMHRNIAEKMGVTAVKYLRVMILKRRLIS